MIASKFWFLCLTATRAFMYSKGPIISETTRQGIFDAFKNESFEDESETRDSLSTKLVPVTIGSRTVQALPNQSLKTVVRAAGAPIKFNCENGRCGTCENRVDGRIVRICKTSVPARGCKITRK